MQGKSTEMNPGYVRMKEPRFLKSQDAEQQF